VKGEALSLWLRSFDISRRLCVRRCDIFECDILPELK
jgi:hypothetical protein